jgi:phosphatidylethanolamine/phosphatidyl-N-methylethanolamine N-methyltransferase
MTMRAEPDLADYHRQFEANYEKLNYARNLSSRVLAHSHVLVERPFGPDAYFPAVLEVGAGSGIHFGHVRHRFDTYLMTDANPNMLEQAKRKTASDARFRFEREDAAHLSFPDASFDRLIATHVLEHMPAPHEVIREWARVIRPGGVLSIVLPCDPGFAWRFGRNFGVKQRATAAGMEYAYWMAREHVNSIFNLVTFLNYYFADISAVWWPLRVPSADLNLIYAANIRI